MTFEEEMQIREERIKEMAKDLEQTGMLEGYSRCVIAAQELIDAGWSKQSEGSGIETKMRELAQSAAFNIGRVPVSSVTVPTAERICKVKVMAKCKECGYCEPMGERWMCLNPENAEGDFVMFVNPDDDHDKYRYCSASRRKEQSDDQ